MIEGFGTEIFYGVLIAVLTFITLFKILHQLFGNADIQPLNRELAQEENSRPPVYNPSTCPICLSNPHFALETNCGHLYCGTCLRTHYLITRNAGSSDIVCALCRQRVVLIFNCFTSEESQNHSDPVREEVEHFVRQYNRYIRNDITLLERIMEFPVLFRHFLEDSLPGGTYEFFRVRLILLLGMTIFYVLLPYDIFPEFVYGIWGYAEDVVLFFIIISYIFGLYRNFLTDS